MTGPMAAERVGITYRQLDHWYRRGYLGPVTKPGSGYDRHVTVTELARLQALAALVKAGMRVDVAAQHLDNATTDEDGTLTLTSAGLTITIRTAA